tara:strand:+ start:7752 stop:9269 length:1518 start_codon:yes stop_codon:yes gene_type:complete
MSLLTNFFIIILYIATAVSIYGFNTVRPNEVIFNTGHYIRDDVNTEAGMTSPIPKNVCYKKTLKSEPVECEYNYAQYYTSFVANPVPGTINIGININPDEDARKLRIMVSNYDGEFTTTPIPTKGSIQGFAANLVSPSDPENNSKLSMSSFDSAGLLQQEMMDGSTLKGLPSAFTNLQVGSSRYGESVWIYNDSDAETLTIGGFEAVDFSLEPTKPQPFSINAIRQTNGSYTNNNGVQNGAYYPPGVTYLTDHVRIQDISSEGGEVCINQKEPNNFDHCDENSKGIFIKGDVIIGKLFGLVGFVQYRTGETTTNQFPSQMASLDVYLDVNMDGCKGTTTTTYNIGFDEHSVCPEAGDEDKVDGYMVSYIGYLKAKQVHNYSGLFWMEVHDDTNASPACLSNPDGTVGGSTGRIGVSNTGLFDYQSGGWNENASFNFIFVEAFGSGNTEVDRYIKFCNLNPVANYTASSAGGWEESAVKYMPEDGGVSGNFEFGVAVYGIPVTTQQ